MRYNHWKLLLVLAVPLLCAACGARQETGTESSAAPPTPATIDNARVAETSTTASSAVPGDACSLLSVQDASDIVGVKLARTASSEPEICVMVPEDKEQKRVGVVFAINDGTAQYDKAVQFDRAHTSMLSGLGDRSYANVTWPYATIGAVKGERTISLRLMDVSLPPKPDVQQKAIALARNILEKL